MRGTIKLYSWNMELICQGEYTSVKERNKWMKVWKERHPTAYYFIISPVVLVKEMDKIKLPPIQKGNTLNFTPDEKIKIIRPKAEYSNRQFV